jgi:hypothetical protein
MNNRLFVAYHGFLLKCFSISFALQIFSLEDNLQLSFLLTSGFNNSKCAAQNSLSLQFAQVPHMHGQVRLAGPPLYLSFCFVNQLITISLSAAGFDTSRARHCAPTLTEESHVRTLVGATDLDGCHTFGRDMPGVDCVDSHRGPVVEGDTNSGRTQGGDCIGGDFAPASVIWDHVNSASSCTFYSDPECGALLGEASELFSGCLVAPERKQIQSFRCVSYFFPSTYLVLTSPVY